MLDIGTKKHMELGRIMDHAKTKIKRCRALAIAGYLLLIFGVLIFLFEVIL